MTYRADFDVAALPDAGFNTRAPIWWGQLWMMAIEGTIFTILIASYFYTRAGYSVWPPPRAAVPGLGIPTLVTALLLVSCIPMRISEKAATKANMRLAAITLGIGTLIAIAVIALRWYELNQWNFKWSTGIFGSYVWCLVGLHTMHLIADTVESLVILGILTFGRVGAKQQQGVEVDGLYWYFVVLIWIPVYIVVYIYPAMLKG